MKRGAIVVGVFLSLLATFALAPTAALAQRHHGGRVAGGHVVGGQRTFGSHQFGSHQFGSRPFVHHHHFFPRHFLPRPFFGPFIPFGVIAPPVVVYSPPPVYYGAPAYYDPPPYYGPPPGATLSVAPAPAPAPMPSVVQYPNGRYELRGDGVTTPYTWVWIPNPPPPPPPAAPPAGAPTSGEQSPPRHVQVYRWVDEEGVVHLTDRQDAVPPRYRALAKQS